MEEAFRALLLGTPAVADLVGAGVDWGARPQGTPLPAIVLHLVGGVPQVTYAGGTGWNRDRLQIDCWGRTHRQARDVGATLAGRDGLLIALRRDLPGLRLRTSIIGRRGDSDTDAEGTIYRASIDVLAWHCPLPL